MHLVLLLSIVVGAALVAGLALALVLLVGLATQR